MEYNKQQIIKLLESRHYQEAISILESILNDSKLNHEGKFDLALLLINTVVYADGYIYALELLDGLISENEFNTNALILKAYIEDMYIGNILDSTLDIIDSQIKSEKKSQYYNQLFLLKALYFKKKNTEEYYLHLKEALKQDLFSSNIYYLLSKFYRNNETNNMQKDMFRNAIENIKYIYKSDEYISPLDFDDFINENIRGVNISEVNYESLKDSFNMR